MFNLRNILFPTIGLSLISIGSCILPSQAQALINFTNEYDFSTTSAPVPEKGLIVGPGEGISKSAGFGLTKFTSLVYSSLADALAGTQTGAPFIFDSNPQTFGKNEPQGGITFIGEGNDKLFGTLKGTNTVNPSTLTTTVSGDIIINGGEGRFKSASGIGTVLANFSLDFNKPVNTGKALINLSFDAPKSIPENTSLVGISVAALGASLMFKKKHSRTKVEVE
ncbi:hypothetical protein RIVM261_007960 [Rivularia sp. IAM M-261]|nr:hypothetical protein RIVM261_007960 [Rivularia sp. IAM M-261]